VESREPSRRRTPTQDRARETLSAIVEAAARVFAADGLRGSTIAHIADVAGVSVGSLYQYFPSKQALVLAVHERETNEMVRRFFEIVAVYGLEDIPGLLRASLASLLERYDRNAALYRVLFHEVPRVAGMGPNLRVDVVGIRSVRIALDVAKDRLQPRDLDAAASLLVRTVRYNLMPLLAEPLVGGEERERFLDELSALLSNYLLCPHPSFSRTTPASSL
jgi:AcrR family transcriptional regulator